MEEAVSQLFDRQSFEDRAAGLMEKQFSRVSKMREFHAGTWIDREYYVRHIVETLLRIRLNNAVDAYALFRASSVNSPLALNLVRYLADEYGHDELFMRDLVEFGLSEKEVNGMAAFRSTESLMGFLRMSVDKDGPASTSIWNCLVEWYSDRHNRVITDHAAKVYGGHMVRGSHGHLEIDERLDHDDLMWQTVERAVAEWSNPSAAYRYLETLVDFIGDYFQELYDNTTGKFG